MEPPATTAPGMAQQQHFHKAETEANHPGQKPTSYVNKVIAPQSILPPKGNGEGGLQSPQSPISAHHCPVREQGVPWQEGAGLFFPLCACDGRDMLGLLQAGQWLPAFLIPGLIP